MDFYQKSLPTAPAHIYTPPPKRKGILAKLLISMMAIAIGGVFLGLGLSTGYFLVQRFMQEPAYIQTNQNSDFSTVAEEPIIIAIDAHTPDFTNIIAKVKDAVVSINVTSFTGHRGFGVPSENHGAGSGFIFAKDDEYVFIATNHHVIANTNAITISLDDNERVPAIVIGSEPDFDLAVLAVSIEDLLEKGVPFTVAALGCSDMMRMGDSVVAIGNAMGAGQTVTKGIISAVNLQISVHDQNTNTSLTLDVLQTDAAVNQGNSGGPLINQNGEVIGIVTAKLFGHGIEGMGYVLPVNDVRDLLIELQEQGPTRHVWLGIYHEEITEPIRQMFNLPATGVLVTRVVEYSPAYFSGFMEWDLMVSFGGFEVTGRDDFILALWEHEPGDEVVVGVYRNGVLIELVVELGSITR
ncbi:MAG: trypsin-like peptidase domain-containing protein [Defluviitaleaceae bacterium]|nr:trypsin-like peptidase domain-containing protein [Defluviitaleaceae bacterium]